jgi:hypothetical protein
MRSVAASRIPLFLASLTMLAAAAAHGQEAEPTDELPGSRPEARTDKSVASGAFLPFTMGARSDAQQALIFGQGGYDSAWRGPVFQTTLEAQVLGRVSVRAGGSTIGPTGSFRPEAGLRVDALRQERHGIDMAVLGVYESAGFNTVKAITARVALSRSFGKTRLVGNVGYGYGFNDGERYGDVRLAGLRAVGRNVHVGLDSRMRFDLEYDNNEPPGEPEWEAVAGPVATYSFNRFVLTGTAGMSAMKQRLLASKHYGAVATLGFGTVF